MSYGSSQHYPVPQPCRDGSPSSCSGAGESQPYGAAPLHSHLCPCKGPGAAGSALASASSPCLCHHRPAQQVGCGAQCCIPSSRGQETGKLAAQGPRGGIRRAHVPHRGIPVPLQNARVNGGRKISCNMAFCDHRDIAKGRKIKKGSVFLSFPFPTSLERLRKYPAIRNNVKKTRYHFPW